MENKNINTNININTKLFSIRTLLFATLVGGPIAGCLMLARNFKQLGDNQAARRSVFQGTLAVLFMYGVLLPFVGIRPLQNGLIWGTEIKIIIVVSTILKLLFGGFIYFRIPPLLQGLIDHPKYTNEESEDKENWAFIWLIAWFISIGFFTFPFSVGLLVNVTGTLLVLSFYFALFIYSQARKVYPGKSAHLFFVSILSLPFAVSPLALHGYNRPGPRIFLLIFFYALVVMFYLFLFTVGLKGLLAINRFIKFVPDRLVKNKIARQIGFYFIILCVTILTVNGHYNVVKPRIETYDIQVPKRHSNLEKLKIVAAADFHLSKVTGPHFVKNIVDKINALNPDLVIIAGDITNERSEVVDWKSYDADFRAIKSKYGVYTVIGNHELQYNPEKTLQFIEHSNMRLLQDKVENIENQFYIFGRNDKSDKQRKTLAELMNNIKEDLPVIMVEHRITEMNDVEAKKIDLHISGHTHAGQLFPLNIILDLFYKLNWGYKKFQDTHFFVTSGVGTAGPPVRVGTFSEIMEINITFK